MNLVHENPFVSIIVPVYNVEKYLRRCLDSIINQTYQDIEIIVVDDGSTDASKHICDEYAKIDSRISVIHKENGGVSSARNVGLARSNGEWVLFVDADDYLPNDALSFYISVVETVEVDMVLGSYVELNTNNDIIKSDSRVFEKQISMLDSLLLFYKSDTNLFQGYIWNRLMRRSIITKNKLEFNESIFFKEDGLFAVQYMVNCGQPCFYSSKIVYNYLKHDNSSMFQYNTSFSHKYLTNLDARILCLMSIKRRYNDKELINRAKYAILFFYNQALYRMNKAKIKNFKLRIKLRYKVINSLGLPYYLRYKLATYKGNLYQYYKRLLYLL